MAAQSLLTDRARAWPDGYIYSLIRYGRGVMPMYGDKVTEPADRWAIVNYVRQLQAAAPPVSTGGRRRDPMSDLQLRTRIATRAVAGSYSPFLIGGGILAVVGLGLFGFALTGEDAPRAWHLFHVNWIYFTGLSAGSLALLAVHKITKAKWSGS